MLIRVIRDIIMSVVLASLFTKIFFIAEFEDVDRQFDDSDDEFEIL